MRPSEIRFSQSTIAGHLTRGDDIHEVITGIARDEISLQDFLPIQIAFHEGFWYAKNNRTLYICRCLEYMEKANDIAVQEVPANRIWKKMSTTNEGVSVIIRGGLEAKPHSIDDIRNRSSQAQGEGPGWGTLFGVGAAVVAGAAAASALSNYNKAPEAMRPSEIRFAQSTIASHLTDGDDIHDVIQDILHGRTSLQSFLPIKVASHEGHWYTKNNRRLYICRCLEYMGKVNKIAVEEVPAEAILRQMTTRNEGVSVSIRGGVRTMPHSIDDIRGRSGQPPSEGSGWGAWFEAGADILARAAAANAASNNQAEQRRRRGQNQQGNNEECVIQ